MFNILVVEDDKNLRKLITTYLQRNKYNTYEATNGEEALNVLDQSYIDLIVSDIMMPKMDGYELIKSLREAKYDVPILIITDFSPPSHIITIINKFIQRFIILYDTCQYRYISPCNGNINGIRNR